MIPARVSVAAGRGTGQDYIADMAKYASGSEAVKIRAAYNSVPAQLTKENRKFQYKVIQKGGNSTIKSGGQAEIDFVMQEDTSVIPVEVKAGERVASRRLNVFVKKYNPPYCIRVSGKNFGFENGIKSVPLYAVFCI